MKHQTRLPTVSQVHHVRQLLLFRLFGAAAIARMTDVPLAVVFRIARSLPKPTDVPLPNPKKQLVDFLELLTESNEAD